MRKGVGGTTLGHMLCPTWAVGFQKACGSGRGLGGPEADTIERSRQETDDCNQNQICEC